MKAGCAVAEQAVVTLAGDPWRAWNSVRSLCNHSSKLGALLEVQAEVPPLQEVLRWHGEPVKALLLPTNAFLTNKRGYPTLSRAHQELLTRFFQMGVQVALPPLQGILRNSSPAPWQSAKHIAVLAKGAAASLAAPC